MVKSTKKVSGGLKESVDPLGGWWFNRTTREWEDGRGTPRNEIEYYQMLADMRTGYPQQWRAYQEWLAQMPKRPAVMRKPGYKKKRGVPSRFNPPPPPPPPANGGPLPGSLTIQDLAYLTWLLLERGFADHEIFPQIDELIGDDPTLNTVANVQYIGDVIRAYRAGRAPPGGVNPAHPPSAAAAAAAASVPSSPGSPGGWSNPPSPSAPPMPAPPPPPAAAAAAAAPPLSREMIETAFASAIASGGDLRTVYANLAQQIPMDQRSELDAIYRLAVESCQSEGLSQPAATTFSGPSSPAYNPLPPPTAQQRIDKAYVDHFFDDAVTRKIPLNLAASTLRRQMTAENNSMMLTTEQENWLESAMRRAVRRSGVPQGVTRDWLNAVEVRFWNAAIGNENLEQLRDRELAKRNLTDNHKRAIQQIYEQAKRIAAQPPPPPDHPAHQLFPAVPRRSRSRSRSRSRGHGEFTAPVSKLLSIKPVVRGGKKIDTGKREQLRYLARYNQY